MEEWHDESPNRWMMKCIDDVFKELPRPPIVWVSSFTKRQSAEECARNERQQRATFGLKSKKWDRLARGSSALIAVLPLLGNRLQNSERERAVEKPQNAKKEVRMCTSGFDVEGVHARGEGGMKER